MAQLEIGTMTARLLSVAPHDMQEDEQAIAKGYRSWGWNFLALIPFGVAYYASIEYVVAASAFVVVLFLNSVEARLYDLCIRLRRTNSLISERSNSK